MINQGAVKLDGEKVTDAKLQIAKDGAHVYQVGKRKFARIKLIV
jgi:tyrosyl-tRNA synthetase